MRNLIPFGMAFDRAQEIDMGDILSHGRRLAIAALLLTLITGLLTVPAFQGRAQAGFNKKQ
jgi:hypothetical protein